MCPRSVAAISRLLLVFIIHFLPLQVQGRPYSTGHGGKKILACLPLHLTRPIAEYLAPLGNFSLPEGLKSVHILVESGYNYSLTQKEQSKRILCLAAIDAAIGLRSPDVAKELQMEYLHHWNYMTLQSAHKAEIEGIGLICTAGSQECYGPAALLLSPTHVKMLCHYESVLLTVRCPDLPLQCYNVSLKQVMNKSRPLDQRIPHHYRLRRILAYPNPVQGKAKTPRQPHASASSDHRHYLTLVGVVWGVVGALLVFFLLALCGGGVGTSTRNAAGQRGPPNGGVAAQQKRPAQEAIIIEDPMTVGTSTTITTTSSKDREMTRSQESVEMKLTDRMNTSSLKDQETERKARPLSSSHTLDPLPKVPKLELAGENLKAEEIDNYKDDNPYDVVPGELLERIPHHFDPAEEGNNGSPQRDVVDSAYPIPYGKVSRHNLPTEQKMDDIGNYAEVRNFVQQGPFVHRDRVYNTSPHANEMGGSFQDKKSNISDSATHMPLPQIPGGAREITAMSNNMTYDSILENTVIEKKSSRNSKYPPPLKKGEQLYESMDEMEDKDLYESVPSDLTKVDSPVSLSTPTASIKNFLDGQATPPVPLSSPVSTNRGVDVKKRNLEHTTSAPFPDNGRKRFSLFGRKKTTSVSSSKVKKGELGSPTSSISSPVHKSPPLHNIPIPPNEDEEDNYDKVTPGLLPRDNAFQQLVLVNDNTSLPHRAGALPHPPLPKLPNDTGSGTIVHKRVIEADEYDVVIFPTAIPDDPNYDTVDPPRLSASNIQDPPYAKVNKKQFMELREQEIATREKMAAEFASPCDIADSDELQELGKPRKEIEALAITPRLQSLATGCTAIRDVTPEDEGHRSQPEHDEDGYAVIPRAVMIRKRALSASRLEPNQAYYPLEKSFSLESKSTSPLLNFPTSPESSLAQYATINTQTKRERHQSELEALKEQDDLRAYTRDRSCSSSPLPPPLPPPPKPEDLVGFEEIPPIPRQLAVHQLDGEDEGPNSPQQLLNYSDTPYAKVRNKVDHLYAVLSQPEDLDEILPIPAQLAVHQLDDKDEESSSSQQLLDNSDPPYAKVKSKVDHLYAVLSQPEDLDEIFPIPAQLAVHQLNDEDNEPNSSQQLLNNSDPPYAKVKSKVDHLYAVVNQPKVLDEMLPIPAQLAVYQLDGENEEPNSSQQLLDNSDPPYAKVKSKVDNLYAVVSKPYTTIDLNIQKITDDVGTAIIAHQASESAVDETAGYDIIIEAKSISSTMDTLYDTISDHKGDTRQFDQELPKLETVTVREMATRDQHYDTIPDIRGDVSQYEQELPKLEPRSVEVTTKNRPYDTFADIRRDIAKANLCNDDHEPSMVETAESDNLYDCLLPAENPTKKKAEVVTDFAEPQEHVSHSMV